MSELQECLQFVADLFVESPKSFWCEIPEIVFVEATKRSDVIESEFLGDSRFHLRRRCRDKIERKSGLAFAILPGLRENLQKRAGAGNILFVEGALDRRDQKLRKALNGCVQIGFIEVPDKNLFNVLFDTLSDISKKHNVISDLSSVPPVSHGIKDSASESQLPAISRRDSEDKL